MASNMVAMSALMQNVVLPDAIPVPVSLPPPPAFNDTLAPNQLLAGATKYFDNLLSGPESMLISNRYVYTGLRDGWVVEAVPPRPFGDGPRRRNILQLSTRACGVTSDEAACGRPLGIRLDREGYLVVADANKGIFKINPVDGRDFRHLVRGSDVVKGQRLNFFNDLALTADGSIYFTSSSAKYNRTQYLDIILDGEQTGKVLVYSPNLNPRLQEVKGNLGFANGIELSQDKRSLLVAEGSRARIHRLWLSNNPAKAAREEIFADNLPGFVDNIRLSPRGTYWVGISSIRSEDTPSVLDRFGDNPQMRRNIMGMPRDQVLAQAPKYGLVLELNDDGQIIRSLHDPEGRVFTGVSEVREENGLLFIGSFDKPYIGILRETSLPRPQLPMDAATSAGGSAGANTGTGTGANAGAGTNTGPFDTGTGTGAGANAGAGTNTGTGTGTGAGANAGAGGNTGVNPGVGTNNQIVNFLEGVRRNAMNLPRQQLVQALMAAIQRLIQAEIRTLRAIDRANQLQSDINSLNNLLASTINANSNIGASAAATTPTPTTANSAAATTTTPSSESTTTPASANSATDSSTDASAAATTTTTEADTTTTIGMK